MSEQSGAITGAKPSSRERDLIAGALRQASPRPKSVTVPAMEGLSRDAFAGYELLKEIHRGGQGVVYQAIQKSTNRKVAIKVIREGPFATTKERQRFEREVMILGQLNHPNIVGIHDSGQAAGMSFVVMDYIQGQPLDAYLAASKSGIDEVLRLFAMICGAVNEAHLRGVVHRDLKPGNVLVDNGGKPHILDFGLAKLAMGELSDETGPKLMTMTGQFLGSLPWASPEQAMGTPGSIDIRTDVYSLGVMLYQMLTGKFPYKVVGNMREVLDNILKAEPAKPSTIRRQINNEVETIVLKCLSKERERRYQSAGELARDLERYLEGEPIEAKRDSGWYVISKTLNRYRWQASAAMVFLAMVVGFGVAMGFLYRKADAARVDAEKQTLVANEARNDEARQKALAQANFEDMRALARVFMYDFNDAIAKLRGTTRAREMVLKAARGTLEKMDKREGAGEKNVAFRRELADAYDKVGELQGRLFGARTGSRAAAASDFARARTIREAILKELPDDPRSHEDLGRSQRNAASMLHANGKYEEAEQEYGRAMATWQGTLRRLPGGDREGSARIGELVQDTTLEMVESLTRSAEESPKDLDKQARLLATAKERVRDVEVYWTNRQSKAPNEVKPRQELARCTIKRAKLEHAAAAAARQAAMELVNATAKIDAADPSRAKGVEQAKNAVAKAVDRFHQAEELGKQATIALQPLAEEKSANEDVQQNLYAAWHEVGRAQQLAAMTLAQSRGILPTEEGEAQRTRAEAFNAAALESMNKAYDISKRRADADEGNIEPRRDMAFSLNKIGNQLRDLERWAEAFDAFDRSLVLRQDLLSNDDTGMHRYDLAMALYKRAECEVVYANRALKEKTKEQAESYERAVRDWLTASKTEFERLRDSGYLGEAPRELKSVTDLQGIVDGNLESLRKK